MTLTTLRWATVILGVLMPYLARLPGIPEHGMDWLTSYFGTGVAAIVFFGLFNAVSWGAALLTSFTLQRVSTALLPPVAALGSSAWLHSTVDLAADAQAAIALIVIPFFTLPFTATAWIMAFLLERRANPAIKSR